MHDRPYKGMTTAELIESAKADLANVLAKLADPQAVHIAMLRGEIAKPSVAQIIHIYGREALMAGLAPGHTDLMVCPETLDAVMEQSSLPEEPSDA